MCCCVEVEGLFVYVDLKVETNYLFVTSETVENCLLALPSHKKAIDSGYFKDKKVMLSFSCGSHESMFSANGK